MSPPAIPTMNRLEEIRAETGKDCQCLFCKRSRELLALVDAMLPVMRETAQQLGNRTGDCARRIVEALGERT